MKTITSALTREKPLRMNTAMVFTPKPPKGYRLVSGLVSTNFGTPTAWRVRDDGGVTVTVSGPTRPGLRCDLIGVFEKLPANESTESSASES